MLTDFRFDYGVLDGDPRSVSYLSGKEDWVDTGEEAGLDPADLVDLIEDTYDPDDLYRTQTLQQFASLFAMCAKIAFQHNGVLWHKCDIYQTSFGSDDPDDLAYLRTIDTINYEHPDNPVAQTFEASLTAGIFGRTLLANAVRPYMVCNLSQPVLANLQEGNAILVSQLTSPDAYIRFLYRFLGVVRDNSPVAKSSFNTVENSIVGVKIRPKFRTSSRKR